MHETYSGVEPLTSIGRLISIASWSLEFPACNDDGDDGYDGGDGGDDGDEDEHKYEDDRDHDNR